jgi:hypothetical protein
MLLTVRQIVGIAAKIPGATPSQRRNNFDMVTSAHGRPRAPMGDSILSSSALRSQLSTATTSDHS